MFQSTALQQSKVLGEMGNLPVKSNRKVNLHNIAVILFKNMKKLRFENTQGTIIKLRVRQGKAIACMLLQKYSQWPFLKTKPKSKIETTLRTVYD